MIDQANNTSTRVYTIDARGQMFGGLRAIDATDRDDFARSMGNQNRGGGYKAVSFADGGAGMQALARDTGGLFIRGTNDLSQGIKKIMDDQRGFYLLAYTPGPDAFKMRGKYPRFNEIKIKVKRKHVSLRYRKGYFGIADNIRWHEYDPSPMTRLMKAIATPLRLNKLGLRVETQTMRNPENKRYAVRSDAFIKRDLLKYGPEENGRRRTHLYMLVILLDKKGKVLEQRESKYLLGLKSGGPPELLEKDWRLEYITEVKKHGSYQVRIAVYDETSGISDMVAEYIEVKKKK